MSEASLEAAPVRIPARGPRVFKRLEDWRVCRSALQGSVGFVPELLQSLVGRQCRGHKVF